MSSVPGKQVPLVLVPRYTSYMGDDDYVSAPLDVSPYNEGTITVWRGKLTGTGTPTFKLYVQGSTDTDQWEELLPESSPGVFWIDPGEDQTVVASFPCDYRWLRVKVTISGTDPCVSCWATGFLVSRVR